MNKGLITVEILVQNGLIVTMDRHRNIIKNGSVAIEGNRIIDIGKTSELKNRYRAERVIDADGGVILPGLINTHLHATAQLMRGLVDEVGPDKWVPKCVWPLWGNVTEEEAYVGAAEGFVESLKSGTTCVNDFSPFNQAGAAEEVGIRGQFSREITVIPYLNYKERKSITPEFLEKKMTTETEEGFRRLEENIKIIKDWHGRANGRVQCRLGPLLIWPACPPDLLREVRKQATKNKVGIHIHVDEMWPLEEEVRRRYGKSPVKLLKDLGILGPDLIAVHCIHVSNDDINILKETDSKVAHCPVSNAKIHGLIAPIPTMLRAGVTVGLATDSAQCNNCNDMFREMRFAAIIHKVNTHDPTAFPPEKALEMATIDGARALGLEKEIGSIEIGKKADLIVVNAKKPHLAPMVNVISNLVYCANGGDVETVIVDGRVLVQGGKILTVDETSLLEKTQEASKNMLVRAMPELIECPSVQRLKHLLDTI